MAAKPTLEQIMEAVSESGYLMEQEVATQFEKRGFHVRTNVPYEDLEEKKSREIDVTAVKSAAYDVKSKLAAFIEIIAECKNSNNPFIFIARNKNREDQNEQPEEFLFPFHYHMSKDNGVGGSIGKAVPAFSHLGFDKVFSEHVNTWKAVQFCRIDRKSDKWHANHGGLYDATFYPMVKALLSRKQGVSIGSRPDAWRNMWFFFPVVITSGDLFLIDSTAETPRPQSVDHISFKRKLKSGVLSGSYMLTFVRQQSLEPFLQTVVEPIASLAAELINDRSEFLTTTLLPWSD